MYMVNIFAQSKATNQYFHVSPALERAHAISKSRASGYPHFQ